MDQLQIKDFKILVIVSFSLVRRNCGQKFVISATLFYDMTKRGK